MASSPAIVIPDASSQVMHIYYDHSSASPNATAVLYLHRNELHGQSVEYVSQGAGLTDRHGEWDLSAEDRLTILFNCREGTSARSTSGTPSSARSNLPLHPTILHRLVGAPAPGAPENATWEGHDNKVFVIWPVHFKSFVFCGIPS